jgi:hypothetical protein
MIALLVAAALALPHDKEWTCNMITSASIQKGYNYTPGLYKATPLSGGSGSGATADLKVGPNGGVDDIKIISQGSNYTVGDKLTAPLPKGRDFLLTVDGLTDFHPAFALKDIKTSVRNAMTGRNPCHVGSK